MIPAASELEQLLGFAVRLARGAGEISLRYFNRLSGVDRKADGSFVTAADREAEAFLRAEIEGEFPDDAILGEEEGERAGSSGRRWIVDPIDGTDQFVRHTDEFDVLVALLVDGRPVVAAGYHPPTGLLCAAARDEGAWTRRGDEPERRPLRLDPVPAGRLPQLATSVWFGAPTTLPALTRVADRLGTEPPEVHLTGFSPRLFLPDRGCDALIGLLTAVDQTMAWEWDFAVADLFIHEAGGQVTDLHGRPHRYNKPSPRNEGGLLAAADPAVHARLLAALRPELPSA